MPETLAKESPILVPLSEAGLQVIIFSGDTGNGIACNNADGLFCVQIDNGIRFARFSIPFGNSSHTFPSSSRAGSLWLTPICLTKNGSPRALASSRISTAHRVSKAMTRVPLMRDRWGAAHRP